MNQPLIDKIVQAVQYEGYILYPYRRGTKNRQRWTFGSLFPRDYSEAEGGAEPFAMQIQCLLRGSADTKISLNLRFLHLSDRQVARQSPDGSLQPVDSLEVAGKCHQSWQEAVERSVILDADLTGQPRRADFKFPRDQSTEPLSENEGQIVAALVRKQSAIQGNMEFLAERQRDDVYQLTLRILNSTPLPSPAARMIRDQALMHSMASTHLVLSASGGEFISQIDPPADLAELASRCRNVGAWPVLVGDAGQTDAMLASPVILYDYPQIAAQSPGDLFDGTEIDEILSLRILTLSEEEKRLAADLDDRGAALLRRTEGLARQQLAALHGTMRPPPTIETLHIGDAELRVGDHVRLRPNGRADAFDFILRGKSATIAAIEQDFENRLHVAVTIDEDPGADIGAAGKIGHRFYFRPEEIEPIRAAQEAS
jgi:hypothetical protein